MGQMQVADHAADDGALLVILQPEDGVRGLRDLEEL